MKLLRIRTNSPRPSVFTQLLVNHIFRAIGGLKPFAPGRSPGSVRSRWLPHDQDSKRFPGRDFISKLAWNRDLASRRDLALELDSLLLPLCS